MTENRFANYTRSTAFSMSLSARMVSRVTQLWKLADLADRYPWWTPPAISIGGHQGDDLDLGDFDGTVRALARRGLVDLVETSTGARLALTRPGRLVGSLLVEAGFTSDLRLGVGFTVPPHPDDCDDLGGRPFIEAKWVDTGLEVTEIARPRDRRLDLWQPGDEQWWDTIDPATQAELDALQAAHAGQQAVTS